MGDGDAFLALAETLYAGAPIDFTPARNAAEKAARLSGDRELAARIKGLRKPSVGAWAVNLLVRWEAEQIDQVFAIAQGLREAAGALDGEELRQLTRQRRQLTAALTTRARTLALEQGQRLSTSVADQVEETLTAAMLDDGAASAVRTGMLVTTVVATGVEEVAPEALVAFPEVLGRPAPPVDRAARVLHVVPETTAVRRAVAADRLAEAQGALARATAETERLRAAASEREAAVLQLRDEHDQLQRQIVDLESRATRAEEMWLEADATATESAAELPALSQAVKDAEKALEGLR